MLLVEHAASGPAGSDTPLVRTTLNVEGTAIEGKKDP
jgi:hypothetical protein